MSLATSIGGGLRKPRFNLLETIGLLAIASVAFSAVIWNQGTRYTQFAAAAFKNPFPEVRLAEEKIIPDESAYKQKYDFTTNWFTWNIPVWERALSSFKGKPNLHYLEIGTYEGRSAVWMLENVLTDPTARMTVIDLFDGPYKERYRTNMERACAGAKVTTIKNFSQLALRELPLNTFDIIYIDGSHAEEDVLEDAVLSWRLLKPGGILIFDDYRWAGCFVPGTTDAPTDFPKTAIDPFVQCFFAHLDVIHNGYQVILRKRPPAIR